MKNVFKIALEGVMCLCLLACHLLLTGCTYKTYKLVGLIDLKQDKIVYYKDLPDEQKEILDAYHSYTIKLQENGKFEIKYSFYQKPILETTSITGKFTLEDNVLTFILEDEKGQKNSLKQQYSNGRIIYYEEANQVYLVFE